MKAREFLKVSDDELQCWTQQARLPPTVYLRLARVASEVAERPVMVTWNDMGGSMALIVGAGDWKLQAIAPPATVGYSPLLWTEC
jgi:hypothetical protein